MGALTAFLLPLAIYLATMPPSITWRNDGADGGELATAAFRLGIPHPPGYPTYVLVGRLFTLLPWGDIAHRLGLLSAVSSAFACGMLYLTTWHLLEASQGPLMCTLSALVAALSLAFSGIFWSQATIVEVYALNAAFAAAIVYLAFPSGKGWPGRWRAALLGLAFGLGLGNHLSLALLLPMAAAALWPEAQDRPGKVGRDWPWAIGPFLLGLLVYVYLPWRARSHLVVNWGGPGGTLWLVTARQYQELAFGLPLKHLPARLGAWARLLLIQFGPWGMALALAGLGELWMSRRRLCLASLLGFALPSLYAIGYLTADSYIYLIPAYMMTALWLGLGVGLVAAAAQRARAARWQSLAHRGLVGILVLLPLVSLVRNYSSQNLRGDREAYAYGRAVLAEVESGALVVADTDRHTFALWYFRYGLMERADIAVLNAGLLQYRWYREGIIHSHPELSFASESADPRQQLRELLAGQAGKRPAYLTFEDEELRREFSLVEVGGAGLYRAYLSGG